MRLGHGVEPMIVVTGASGLLGASLVMLGRDLGREVIGVCHRHLLRIPGVRICQANLADRQAMRNLLVPLRPKSIIHCAAITEVDWCELHPEETEEVNVQASSALAELAQELNAQFLYVSTDSVFDGTRGNYSEDDQPAPLSVYAKSKWRGEQEVLCRHSSPLIVRVNIYGWNAQPKQSLAEWILDDVRTRKPVSGFADVYFCPMLANDLAEVLLTMLDLGLNGIYHVAGSERISKYDFATRVAKTFSLATDCVVPTSLVEARLVAPRPVDSSLNTEKVRIALGRPMPDVDQGLRQFRLLHESGYQNQLKSFLVGAEQ
jgi:dTDP-4-dehydrorhamnose reductase